LIQAPCLIVFIGTVGAGKSTQLRLLASILDKSGFKVKTTCLKTNHFPSSLAVSFLKKLLARNRSDLFPVRALMEEKPAVFKRLFKFWLALDAISTSVRSLTAIYLPLKAGRIVLVEEYFYASIADYIYTTKLLGLPQKTVLPAVNLIQRIMRLYHVTSVFFLDASNSELNRRWQERLSLTEKTEYLEMQRTLLLSASKSFSSVFYVKTSCVSIKETNDFIINQLCAS
jgi:thymidylate kinase